MRKTLSLVLLVVFLSLAGQASPAHAQTQITARISLYSLQIGDFPTMTAGLDVFDSAGNPVPGLKADAITLLEDDQPRPLTALDDLPVGVQFALAFDPGPAFAFQDLHGSKRYDKVYQVLKDWADTHSDALGDDLSLIPTEGTVSAHVADSAAFSQALTDYSPSLARITPSLSTLSQALDAVSDKAPQDGMKRVVLFVTSPPGPDALPTLDGLTKRALDQQVRVIVWIVASKDSFSTAPAQALENLATTTGGQYLLFSGVEPLPGLETYLAPLRHTYRLTYNSTLLASGSHSLVAQTNLNGATLTSAALAFQLNIQPPNPILVSPPDQIVRSAPDQNTTDLAAFLPAKQEIDMLVEFPDGRKRPLVRTALYVDNVKVAENTAEPFDKFSWDLSGYTVSGEHILQVEAMDSFGLSKTSLGVPVTVTVIQPKRGLLPFLAHNSLWVAGGAVLVAGAVLGVILASGRRRRTKRPPRRRVSQDPLTQPVTSEPARRGPRLPWSRPVKPSEAYLVRLKENGEPVTAPPIPVLVPEMVFGSDPIHANRVLDDASVSPLHARLRQDGADYLLSDEKSTAGTWVNFEQLIGSRRLQHGDVIHIGRLMYRFMLRKPPEPAVPKVTRTKK